MHSTACECIAPECLDLFGGFRALSPKRSRCSGRWQFIRACLAGDPRRNKALKAEWSGKRTSSTQQASLPCSTTTGKDVGSLPGALDRVPCLPFLTASARAVSLVPSWMNCVSMQVDGSVPPRHVVSANLVLCGVACNNSIKDLGRSTPPPQCNMNQARGDSDLPTANGQAFL